jgi:hypothetical protein
VDFGFGSLYYDLNPGAYLLDGDESLVTPLRMQREKAVESSLHADYHWDVTTALTVNAGLRYSHFGALGPRTHYRYDDGILPSPDDVPAETITTPGGRLAQTYLGPEYRFSARYAFSADLSVKAGVNTVHTQTIEHHNHVPHRHLETERCQRPPPKRVAACRRSVQNFAGPAIETSVETYYKTMDNYPDYRKGSELLMNPHIETDILPVHGCAYGIELMLKKTRGKLSGWASYTYSRTLLRQSDPRVPSPVNGGEWFPADFDKPHDFKLACNYKFTQRFSVSINCDYSTGRPVTLSVSKYRMEGGEFVYYSDRNQYRIPDFFHVDTAVNIEPSHHLTLLTRSSFSLGIYNLTARRNVYSVFYMAKEGKLHGYRLAIFGIPIPTFHTTLNFKMNMQMKQYIGLLTATLAFTFLSVSCIDRFEPGAGVSVSGILVIDATITAGITTVRLSRSIGMDQDWHEGGEIADATLHVACDDGFRFSNVVYQGEGIYDIETPVLDPAKQYNLHISLDGEEYESSPLAPILTPTIDSIAWQKQAKGSPVHITVSTHDDDDRSPYYRWTYREDWEFKSELYAAVKFVANINGVNYYKMYDTRTSDNIYYCWGDRPLCRLHPRLVRQTLLQHHLAQATGRVGSL